MHSINHFQTFNQQQRLMTYAQVLSSQNTYATQLSHNTPAHNTPAQEISTSQSARVESHKDADTYLDQLLERNRTNGLSASDNRTTQIPTSQLASIVGNLNQQSGFTAEIIRLLQIHANQNQSVLSSPHNPL